MVATAACGGRRMDGGDDKKRKRPMPQDAPDLPGYCTEASETDFDDDESAPTVKPKSNPSFRLTKFGNTRTREIAKKHRIEHRKFLKALKDLAEAERVVAAARTTLAVLSEEEEAKKSFLQEIAKKCRIKHRKVQKALKELAEVERAVAAARDGLAVLFDQPTDEGNQEEEVDDDNKKATKEEEDAEISKGGASGSQSDHSMAEAGLSNDNANDEDNGGKK